MKLLTGIPSDVLKGKYSVTTTMSSGTSKIQTSIEAQSMVDIPDSSKSATTTYIMDIPNCRIQSVITGDAELWLNQV